jgi:mycothiol system anti-sigma-R factor
MTDRMKCEEVIERLMEFLDREVDPATDREIARHMETCRACFSRAEFERKLRVRVSDTGDAKAPDSLRRRMRAILTRY